MGATPYATSMNSAIDSPTTNLGDNPFTSILVLGKTIVAGRQDGQVEARSSIDGSLLWRSHPHKCTVMCITGRNGDDTVVSSAECKDEITDVAVLSLASGKELRTYSIGMAAYAFSIQPDATMWAAGYKGDCGQLAILIKSECRMHSLPSVSSLDALLRISPDQSAIGVSHSGEVLKIAMREHAVVETIIKGSADWGQPLSWTQVGESGLWLIGTIKGKLVLISESQKRVLSIATVADEQGVFGLGIVGDSFVVVRKNGLQVGRVVDGKILLGNTLIAIDGGVNAASVDGKERIVAYGAARSELSVVTLEIRDGGVSVSKHVRVTE